MNKKRLIHIFYFVSTMLITISYLAFGQVDRVYASCSSPSLYVRNTRDAFTYSPNSGVVMNDSPTQDNLLYINANSSGCIGSPKYEFILRYWTGYGWVTLEDKYWLTANNTYLSMDAGIRQYLVGAWALDTGTNTVSSETYYYYYGMNKTVSSSSVTSNSASLSWSLRMNHYDVTSCNNPSGCSSFPFYLLIGTDPNIISNRSPDPAEILVNGGWDSATFEGSPTWRITWYVSNFFKSGLSPGTTYYWRIRGDHPGIPDSYFAGGSFTTAVATPSPTPTPTPTPKQANFGIISSTYSIGGTVFVDANRNGKKDGGENCYNQAVTLNTTNVSSGATSTHPLSSGCNYTISRPQATYQVSFTPPAGFILTTSSTRTVSIPPDATGVDFGISVGNPWFQTKEGDVRSNTSISVNLPSGKQFSLDGSGGSPGIVFYGTSGTQNFGQGSISSKNWLAQENYAQAVPTYDSLRAQAQRAGTITALGCDSCGSPPSASGVYTATGDVTISSGWTVPSGRNVVIFVPGNLAIQGGANQPNIDVAAGGFLAFVVKGNIAVNSSVGNTDNSKTTSNLEGWYIVNGNFNTVDTGTTNKRLNIEGLVLFGGSLVNPRDLGADNSSYPTLLVSYRLDLALSAGPLFARSAIRWEEIAP